MPVIFPFAPDDVEDIVVTRAWLTDVITSELGGEQRVSLRDEPRVTLGFGLRAMTASESGRVQSFLDAAASDLRFLLPFWPDAVPLYGPVSAGGTLVPAETTGRRFVDGEGVMLWQPGDHYEVATLDDPGVAPTELTLDGPTTYAWPAISTAIVPLVTAVLRTPARLDLVGAQTAVVSVEFDLETALAGVQLADTGERSVPAVASMKLDPQRAGQGTNMAAGTFVTPEPHWYYRVRCYDATGVPIRHAPVVWSTDNVDVDILQSFDPYVVRVDTSGLFSTTFTLTATSGSVSVSRTISV